MSCVSQDPETTATEQEPQAWEYRGIPIAIRTNKTLDKVFQRIQATEPEKEVSALLTAIFKAALDGEVEPEDLTDPDCPICKNPMGQNAVRTTCGHVFGYFCLGMWWNQFEKPLTCPICRAQLGKQISELQLLGPSYTKAFMDLKENSNNWTIAEMEQKAAIDLMDTDDWVQELAEIYAGLLWTTVIQKSSYRQKAKGRRLSYGDWKKQC
jgi:hypothetical protein